MKLLLLLKQNLSWEKNEKEGKEVMFVRTKNFLEKCRENSGKTHQITGKNNLSLPPFFTSLLLLVALLLHLPPPPVAPFLHLFPPPPFSSVPSP